MDWLPISELDPILRNEAVTSGLQDPEAQLLVKWMVLQSENFARTDTTRTNLTANITELCRRGRAIKRFVILYCYQRNTAAAYQLAAAVRFTWPLPTGRLPAYDLMQDILDWETESFLDSSVL